jgi:hypothetical protein
MLYRTAVLGITLGLTACATGANRGNGINGSQVSGVIAIPDDFQGSPAEFCGVVEIKATDASGARVGRSYVTASTDKCVYDTTELPVSGKVSVTVQRGGVLQCLRGASIALTPDSVTVQIKAGETQTADFAAICQG